MKVAKQSENDIFHECEWYSILKQDMIKILKQSGHVFSSTRLYYGYCTGGQYLTEGHMVFIFFKNLLHNFV